MRRRFGEAGLSVVMSDNGRRSLGLIGELLLQSPRDIGVDALATAAHQ